MENFLEALGDCPLFEGIAPEDIGAVLRCLGTKTSLYGKGETIIAEGEPAKYVGIVLSGVVQIVQVNYFGNRSIVAGVGSAELFGESFACAGAISVPVSAVAAEPAWVMLIDCARIVNTCTSACAFHQRMLLNLLKVVAAKNLVFHQKIEVTSKRSTREKLVTYLLQQAKRSRSGCFEIPYNRQELADYLGVDRSGLSVEIGKLRRLGLIDAKGKRFKILKELES
ncbi:Crp/Fnr family transcriptional regulator [Oscillibacter sp.]|uniref:Crp/Fnr family transcriptional regulator n=1 Tax=Oscillibacter sp. TaxID=1945593 RepID=UPI002D801E16|nr:Crp/Fnr family transcriptional regulator [Oscillibacter sp.]